MNISILEKMYQCITENYCLVWKFLCKQFLFNSCLKLFKICVKIEKIKLLFYYELCFIMNYIEKSFRTPTLFDYHSS